MLLMDPRVDEWRPQPRILAAGFYVVGGFFKAVLAMKLKQATRMI